MNTPDSPKEAALYYAAAGVAVLALYGVRDDGACLCGNSNCSSPGKHPETLLSKSVYGATTEPEEIATWNNPNINLGANLGKYSNGLMAIDIDIPEVAEALLDVDLALFEQTAIVRTGRGAHIYFQCTDLTKTAGFNMRLPDGAHLGEVRGDGQIAVLPPSRHANGNRYTWINKTWQLDETDDPYDYMTRLLKMVNVEVKFDSTRVEISDEDVQPIAMPVQLDNRLSPTVRMLVRGVLRADSPEVLNKAGEGRSGVLFWLVNEVAEAAFEHNIHLDEDTLAGIISMADQRATKKYIGRWDASRRYRELAKKALQSTGTVPATMVAAESDSGASESASVDASDDFFTADADAIDASRRERDYLWDPGDGVLYYKRWLGNAKSPKLEEVCNFVPKILVEYEVDDGDQVTRSWKCRFILNDGRYYDLTLSEEDRSSGNKVTAALAKLPAMFSIRARQHLHVIPAMQDLSGNDYDHQHEFAMTGWVESNGVRKYILPSSMGAIGPDGLDTSIVIDPDNLPEDATITEQDLAPYGRAVRPPLTLEEAESAWNAFWTLLNAGAVPKTTAILLQIIAGPLIPAGAGESPPLVHVLGGTGTLKTSFCTTALSMFGTWKRDETPPPATWGSTPLYLQAMLHTTKDLTLLVDDYKAGVVDRQKEVVRLIQQYADRTARGRASVSGGTRKTKLPRGLLLSNGEDMWERTASAEARTIQIGLKPRDIDRERLGAAQESVQRGDLQRFGGMWLQWLAKHPEIFDNKVITSRRDSWRETLAKDNPLAHLRVLSSVAVLGAVGSVLVDFVREEFPDYEDSVADAVGAATEMLVGGARESDRTVKSYAPFRQLASAVSEAMAAHEVSLSPRGHTPESRGTEPIPNGFQRTITVGFWWDEDGHYPQDGTTLAPGRYVLLTQNTAMRWYRGALLRSGEQAPFSWGSVVKDAVDNFGGVSLQRVRVAKDRVSGNMSQMSGVVVPLEALDSATEIES